MPPRRPRSPNGEQDECTVDDTKALACKGYALPEEEIRIPVEKTTVSSACGYVKFGNAGEAWLRKLFTGKTRYSAAVTTAIANVNRRVQKKLASKRKEMEAEVGGSEQNLLAAIAANRMELPVSDDEAENEGAKSNTAKARSAKRAKFHGGENSQSPFTADIKLDDQDMKLRLSGKDIWVVAEKAMVHKYIRLIREEMLNVKKSKEGAVDKKKKDPSIPTVKGKIWFSPSQSAYNVRYVRYEDGLGERSRKKTRKGLKVELHNADGDLLPDEVRKQNFLSRFQTACDIWNELDKSENKEPLVHTKFVKTTRSEDP